MIIKKNFQKNFSFDHSEGRGFLFGKKILKINPLPWVRGFIFCGTALTFKLVILHVAYQDHLLITCVNFLKTTPTTSLNFASLYPSTSNFIEYTKDWYKKVILHTKTRSRLSEVKIDINCMWLQCKAVNRYI